MSRERTAELRQIAESMCFAVEIAGKAEGLNDPELVIVTIMCAVMLISKNAIPAARADLMDGTCRMLREMCDLELAKPGSMAPLRASGVMH